MPSTQLTRRRFLQASSVLGATALGGCSRLQSTDRTTERALRLSLSEMGGTLRERYVVDLEETPVPWDEMAFDAALNGSSFTTQGHSPFVASDDEPRYARHDGSYYHLDSVVVGKRVLTHPVLRLETVGRPSELDSVPEHVSVSDLPEGDRGAVQVAYMAARARNNAGGAPWGLVERDGYVYRNETAIAESQLLGGDGPTHVEYRGTIYEVAVTRERFHEAVYRPDVEAVAETESDIEAILQAQLVEAYLDPDDLSEAEREIVRTARQESYSESHPYSPAYESLLKRLEKWPYLDGDIEKDAGVETNPRRPFIEYGEEYLRYQLVFETTGQETS